MEARHLLLAALVLVDLPAFYILLRLLFRGPFAAASGPEGDPSDAEDSPARPAAARRLPRLRELLDPAFLKDSGGEMKILLFLLTAALLVLIEYFIILGAFPGIAGARL